ncbi:hypothetical protein [Acidovorax sp.]|uniref:hypothetical protein n=1 Tax=Acidovorax sp. TaxID=1872122 RepID=UPI002ACE234F|nr:hypothetical protein [Acidovorax sp.]MDZ7863783.1 hypothetical protein [Acidovorax sp.]
MHRWKTPLLCGLAFVATALAYNAATAVDFAKWLCALPLLTWLLLKVRPRPPAAPPVAFAG